MEKLVFECTIGSGMGMYSQLSFPTHEEMPGLPADWPDRMFKGSLNAAVDKYPDEFERLGKGLEVQKLDNKTFPPALTIPQGAIGNNTLAPRPGMPERGAAQAWRARIEVEGRAGATADVWAVRRIGSAYYDIIELMSEKKLRDALGLQNGDKIRLTLFAGQSQPQATAAPRPRSFLRRAIGF